MFKKIRELLKQDKQQDSLTLKYLELVRLREVQHREEQTK